MSEGCWGLPELRGGWVVRRLLGVRLQGVCRWGDSALMRLRWRCVSDDALALQRLPLPSIC
jgi:hypothetical protein